MLSVHITEYTAIIFAVTVTNRSPHSKHDGRTHALPTGRTGGKPQWIKQRVPIVGVADALAFLRRLTAMERNYIRTAFDQLV